MNESPSSPEDGADGGGGACRRMSETGSKPRRTRSSRDEQHDELRKRMASRKSKSNAETPAQADAAHPYIPSNKPRGERTRVVKKEAHARGEHHKPRRVMKEKPSAAADPAAAEDLGKSMNLDDLGASTAGMDHSGMDDSGLSTNSRGERRPRRSRRPPKEGEEPREREHRRRDKPQRRPSSHDGEEKPQRRPPSHDGEENTDDKESDEGAGGGGTMGRRDSMGAASRRRRVPGRSKSYDGPQDHEAPSSSGRRAPDRARSGSGAEVSGHSRASREERIAEREERLAAKEEERLAAKADSSSRRASRRVGPSSPGKSTGGDSTVTERRRRRKEGDAPTIETSGSMADQSEPSHSRRGRRTVDGSAARTALRRNRTADEVAPRRRTGSADLDASESIPEDEEEKNPGLRRAHTEEIIPRSPAGARGPRRDRRASRRPTSNNPATASAAQAWVNAIDSRGGNGSIGALYGATDLSDSEEESDEEEDHAEDNNESLNASGSSLMDEADHSERTGKKSRLKTLLPKKIRSAFGGGKKHHTETTTEEPEFKDDLDD